MNRHNLPPDLPEALQIKSNRMPVKVLDFYVYRLEGEIATCIGLAEEVDLRRKRVHWFKFSGRPVRFKGAENLQEEFEIYLARGGKVKIDFRKAILTYELASIPDLPS
jgi:hypothetical protein